MKQKKSISLRAFLRGNPDSKVGVPGCANYDHHYGGCLFGNKCLVKKGKRCGYFEKAVLPVATDIGLVGHVYSLYQKRVGLNADLQRPQTRLCPDCGTGLKLKQRYCDSCGKSRRQKGNRENQKKYRKSKRLIVSS